MKKKDGESSGAFGSAEKSTKSMVDIVACIKPDELFANLKVSSFDLILSLEFLLKLAQFVTVPDDTKPTSGGSTAVTSTTTVTKRKRTLQGGSQYEPKIKFPWKIVLK